MPARRFSCLPNNSGIPASGAWTIHLTFARRSLYPRLHDWDTFIFVSVRRVVLTTKSDAISSTKTFTIHVGAFQAKKKAVTGKRADIFRSYRTAYYLGSFPVSFNGFACHSTEYQWGTAYKQGRIVPKLLNGKFLLFVFAAYMISQVGF